MIDEPSRAQLMLLSPLATIGAALMLAQVLGVVLQKHRLPKLYGAVIAGLLLGTSGAGAVDGPLLSQFQELFNAASALVLFEVGRKMDLGWLWKSRVQGMALLAGCLARGIGSFALLAMAGVPAAQAGLIGALVIAVNPVVVASMTSDQNASGVVTYAGGNTVGVSNLIALLFLTVTLAWARSHAGATGLTFIGELQRQSLQLLLGAAIALLCYGLYALATRLSRARAATRPGILLAALLMDLGLCSVSSASALLSLLLMGLLLRNAENRENVFQAQVKTGQDIGYALLFLMSAALVDLHQLLQWQALAIALAVFALRIGATRLALAPSSAWSPIKKHALALSMCSLVGVGSMVVDSSMDNTAGMDGLGASVMGVLLALNVLLAPALTWYGLRLAGETHAGETDD